MWDFLRRDLGLKITALLLAVFLWVYVAERRPVEIVADLRIAYNNLPSNLTFAARPPVAAKARVRGTGMFARWRLKDVSLAIDLSAAERGVVTHVLSPGEALVPTDRDMQVLEILEPRAVRIDLDALATKELPVMPVLAGTLVAERILVSGPTAYPGRAVITGSRRVLAGLTSIPTVPLDVNQLAKRGRINTKLDLSAMPPLASDVDAVVVSARIESIKELGIPAVPVEAEGGAGMKGRFTPETVDVVISGAASQVDSLDPRDTRLVVDVADLVGGQMTLVPVVREGKLRLAVRQHAGGGENRVMEVGTRLESAFALDIVSVSPEEIGLVLR
jgi:YbbR domain-containing protein